MFWISLIIITALTSIIAAVLFTTSKPHTKPFLDDNGNVVEGSVAEQLYLPLGNVNQWLVLRGENVHNPILIFLHGGPGIPLHGLFRYFHSNLEKYFIVVGWDQRGAGKSYNRSIAPDSMNINTFVADFHELVQYLKKRYDHDKVYILGESWGSLLGILYAHKYPEDVIAYIGTGQISDIKSAMQLGHEFTVTQAKIQNHQKALSQLQAITKPVCNTREDRRVQHKWLMKFGGCLYKKTNYPISWLFGMLRINEYAWSDFFKILPGINISMKYLWQEIFNTNLFHQVPELKVPTYFLLGRHDYNTSSKLAEQYFNTLKAPQKKLIWFEKSGHNPMFEEPDLFRSAVLHIRSSYDMRELKQSNEVN